MCPSCVVTSFYIHFQSFRRIRATSPIFNIITATGSILFYVTVPIMFAPFKTPEEHDLRCQVSWNDIYILKFYIKIHIFKIRHPSYSPFNLTVTIIH